MGTGVVGDTSPEGLAVHHRTLTEAPGEASGAQGATGSMSTGQARPGVWGGGTGGAGEGATRGERGSGAGAMAVVRARGGCGVVRCWCWGGYVVGGGGSGGGYGEYYTEYSGGPGEMMDMLGGGMMDMSGMMMYGYDPSYCLDGGGGGGGVSTCPGPHACGSP